ncbi:hypothetical protein BH23CHL1_BH23CHL1_01060 [soil metagenome]|jgi:hypothetical protein
MAKHDPEYELLQMLDLLIDLREDMQDLGITTLEELELKITELEAQLGDDDDGPV